ncbi:MAG: flippase [Deltaproteobacteria bacterium]|nr:flippase [Deltaproteobacteria bacterium]
MRKGLRSLWNGIVNIMGSAGIRLNIWSLFSHKNNNENSIPKNTLVGFAINVIIFLLAALTNILIVRTLGPKDQGIYFMVITINYMIVSLGNMGIGTANATFLAQKKYLLSDLNFNSVLTAAGAGGICIVFYLIAGSLLHSTIFQGIDPLYVFSGISLVPFTLYMSYWNSMMVGLNEIILLNKILLAQTAFSCFSVIIALIVLKLGINGAIGAWFFTNVISAITMFFLLHKMDRIKLRINYPTFKGSILFGLKSHIGGIATYIWLRLDAFLLNMFHGPSAVGYYSVAVNLTEMLWRFMQPFYNAVTPKIAGATKQESEILTTKATRHVFFILVVVAIVLAPLSPLIIRLLYGSDYLPAYKPMVILLVGTIGVGVAMPTAMYFVGQLNKPGLLSFLAWINAAINIILCFALIPSYGVEGAAMASTMTYIIGFLIIVVVLKKISGFTLSMLLFIKREDFRDYLDVFIKIKQLLPSLVKEKT